MSTAAELSGLTPRLVWEHFLALTRIPRPSKEEDEARRYVQTWADARDFATEADAAGNMVVRVPATGGREAAPTVILQAHLDMVCERDPDSPFDPRQGRIDVRLENDWVYAAGTTLGADNGIGVAAALAVADDDGLAHGPLELLFTVSEEQGLEGAKALDPALLSGQLLLNLDGTVDTGITVGCAGSTHVFARLPLDVEELPAGYGVLEARVSGARGGHSGADIARGRINAIKALGRVLARGREGVAVRLWSLQGGVSRNAIPREARAVVAIPRGDERAFTRGAERELAALREEFAASDGGVELAVEPAAVPPLAASADATTRAIDLLLAVPSGPVAMTREVPGAVETSTSLNVASTENGALVLTSMARSANPRALEAVVETISACSRLAGAEVELLRSYDPWRPDLDSPLLATARASYARVFGREPTLEVVHGGLECAVIGYKVPGAQVISIGPNVEGPHAPGERLSVSSTERFYRLLGAVLDDLSR